MIIQHDILSKDYSEKVLKLFRGGESSRAQYRCPDPNCRSGCFHRHGVYRRYFLELDADWSEVFTSSHYPEACLESIKVSQMKVLRIRCTGCGMTHAVLPGDAIPFFSASLLLVLFLLSHLAQENQESLDDRSVIRSTGSFSWAYLKYLVTLFAAYKNRMLAALRLGGIYTQSRNPSDKDLLHIYLTPPFLSRSYIDFLRFHRKPMFIKRQSTVSYPLRFLFPDTLFF